MMGPNGNWVSTALAWTAVWGATGLHLRMWLARRELEHQARRRRERREAKS